MRQAGFPLGQRTGPFWPPNVFGGVAVDHAMDFKVASFKFVNRFVSDGLQYGFALRVVQLTKGFLTVFLINPIFF